MKVTSPSKQKPQKFFSAAAERRRATKIEQNLEMAVAVIQSADSHKQDRNVTESKRRVEREGREKGRKKGREGGQREIRMLFSVAVRSVSFDVV